MSLFMRPAGGRRIFGNTLDYIDDYRTELYTDSKGRTRERLIYTGAWYKLWGNRKSNLLLMLSAALACVLFTAGLVLLQFSDSYVCVCWFVALPQAAALFPCLYALFGICELPYSCKPMKRDRYMHSVIRVCRSASAVGVIEAFVLIAGFVFRLVDSLWFFREPDILYIVHTVSVILLCGAAVFLLQKLEISSSPNSSYSE